MANVDGSFLTDTCRGGVGCVIRDSKGLVVWGFAAKVDVASALEAELMAIKIIMQEAFSRKLYGLFVLTDCMEAVRCIGDNQGSWNLISIIEDISQIMKLTNSTIAHTPRETNRATDFLARLESFSQQLSFYDHRQLPKRVKGIVALERQGLPYIRSCFDVF